VALTETGLGCNQVNPQYPLTGVQLSSHRSRSSQATGSPDRQHELGPVRQHVPLHLGLHLHSDDL